MSFKYHLFEYLAENRNRIIISVLVISAQDVYVYETLNSLEWVVCTLCPRESIKPVFFMAFISILLTLLI